MGAEQEFLEQLESADGVQLPVMMTRLLRADDVTCPAGDVRGDSKVFCAVEQHAIEGRLSPESVEGFCCGDYKACPTWRLEYERIQENKKAASYLAEKRKEGERARAIREAHKTDRFERARLLLMGDTPEAERFRRRIGVRRQRRGNRIELVKA